MLLAVLLIFFQAGSTDLYNLYIYNTIQQKKRAFALATFFLPGLRPTVLNFVWEGGQAGGWLAFDLVTFDFSQCAMRSSCLRSPTLNHSGELSLKLSVPCAGLRGCSDGEAVILKLLQD